jgi:site-specific recombinase XerD
MADMNGHFGRRKGEHAPNAGATYPPEALTIEEVHSMIDVAARRNTRADTRNRALISLLYRTGLRISEALDLRVIDVDFVNHTVNVLRGKGGKRRTVGIDDWALTQIQEWLDIRQAPPGAPLFCTKEGKRMYPTYFRGYLGRLGRECGIEKRIHPHMFRHTFAVELAREGVPMPYIQRQLGHSSLATTTRYLSTLQPTEVIEAIMAREAPFQDKEITDDANMS